MNLTKDILCPGCNEIIHPKRIEILLKLKKKLVCVKCSTEDKVVGFVAVEGKTERPIQIMSKEKAHELQELAKRTR